MDTRRCIAACPMDDGLHAAYGYDAENCLCVVSNAYDHASRRVVKTTPDAIHTYLYDGWNLVQETVATASGTTTKHYVWGKDLSGSFQGAGGVGGLLAVCLDGAWNFPFYDNNGNVTAYVDESGAVVAEYLYDAFGNTVAQSRPLADAFPHRFSTKYLDPEIGLYYYGYRFYAPEPGRWLNRDPIEEEGGLNLYGFVGNDGINAIDALGEDFVAVGARDVRNTLGLFRHLSISYFVSPCEDEPGEGSRFSTEDIGRGQFASSHATDRWELLRNADSYVRYSGRRWTPDELDGVHRGLPPPRPRRRPSLESVAVSEVHRNHDLAPSEYRVVLADATPADWAAVTHAAQNYGYAEQLPLPRIPRQWPHSSYQMPPLLFGGGNNSNTFVFEMADAIGRRQQAIVAFWNTPGNNHARPVHDDGRTPFLAELQDIHQEQ